MRDHDVKKNQRLGESAEAAAQRHGAAKPAAARSGVTPEAAARSDPIDALVGASDAGPGSDIDVVVYGA